MQTLRDGTRGFKRDFPLNRREYPTFTAARHDGACEHCGRKFKSLDVIAMVFGMTCCWICGRIEAVGLTDPNVLRGDKML